MESNNSKIQDVVFILKAILEWVLYLDIFCYKAIVNVHIYVCISKQIL